MRRQRRHAAPTPYVYRDEFWQDRAAAGVNGTPTRPGPGSRTTVETQLASGFTISGGALNIPVTTADAVNGAQSYLRATDGIVRQAGRALATRMQLSASNNTYSPYFGLYTSTTPSTADSASIRVPTNNLLVQCVGGGPIGTVAANTYFNALIVLRANGYFILSDVGGTWKLHGFSASHTNSPLYPALFTRSSIITSKCEFMRVMDGVRIRSLADDSFAGDGNLNARVMDGLQAEEGGGSGLVWSTVSGTWATASGAAQATALGVATFNPLTANLDWTVNLTMPAAGVTPGGLLCRYTDADNYWYVKIIPGTAGTDFQLIERNAGVETPQVGADIDWVAATAYNVRVVSDGSTWWKAYVDGTERLAYTDSNTFNQTVTTFGIKDEGNSNFTFNSVQCWPRGSEGQYAYLARLFL